METQDLWKISTNNLILLVESVRYLIVRAGGMARKSLVWFVEYVFIISSEHF